MSRDLRPLTHRFAIQPVSEAKAKALAGRAHPGDYGDEPVPEHIRAAVTIVDEDDAAVLLQGPHERMWLPKPVPRPLWFLMARGYRDRMAEKYAFPGFVAVAPGDVVVDCGAYAGGFALAAARDAARVIAVEPARVAFDCLRRNVGDTLIEPLRAGLYDSNGTGELLLHANSTDSTLIADPSAPPAARVPVQLLTVPALMRHFDIARIDFLKLEAEGVELEVLQHVRPEIVTKIAIDAGPERLGASPLLDIAVLLARRGYALANRNYWLYAHAI